LGKIYGINVVILGTIWRMDTWELGEYIGNFIGNNWKHKIG